LTVLSSVAAMTTPGHKPRVSSWALINTWHKIISYHRLSIFACSASTGQLRQG